MKALAYKPITKRERIEMVLLQLAQHPTAQSLIEMYQILCRTFSAIEEYAKGINCNFVHIPETAEMYVPSLTAWVQIPNSPVKYMFSPKQFILIGENGAFEIHERCGDVSPKDNALFFQFISQPTYRKLNKEGKTVWGSLA